MKNTLRALKISLIGIIIAVATLCALTASVTAKAANIYNMGCPEIENKSDPVTADEGKKLHFYLPEMLWSYSATVKVTYQRVELNSAEGDATVPSSNGVVTDKDFKVLDEAGTVAIASKTDERAISNTEINTALKYNKHDYPVYFELTTHENCAYVFTVETKVLDQDAKYTYFTFCYRKVDFEAPTMTKPTTRLVSGQGYRLTFDVSDKSNIKSAVSGVAKVTVYEDETEKIVYNSPEAKKSTTSVSVLCATNKRYYITMSDCAGNTTKKTLLFFYEENAYSPEAEAEYQNAVSDFEQRKYVDALVNRVYNAYADYYVVTRDGTSSESDKQAALAKLNVALREYVEVTDAYETRGTKVSVKVETFNEECTPGLELFGAASGLDFLKIGDKVTISLSAAYFERSDLLSDKEILSAAADGMKRADELYQVSVNTVSEAEFDVTRQFTSEPELRFSVGDYKEIAAVQTVKVGDEETHYRCTVVGHTDGTISVSVPYARGTVRVFVVREKGKSLYWLFSLAAIPLLIGAAMLMYAFKKMNKIKEEALKKKDEEENGTAEIKDNKPPVNKKKKKKKKK